MKNKQTVLRTLLNVGVVQCDEVSNRQTVSLNTSREQRLTQNSRDVLDVFLLYLDATPSPLRIQRLPHGSRILSHVNDEYFVCQQKGRKNKNTPPMRSTRHAQVHQLFTSTRQFVFPDTLLCALPHETLQMPIPEQSEIERQKTYVTN